MKVTPLILSAAASLWTEKRIDSEQDLAHLAYVTKLVAISSCVGVLDGLHGPEWECASFCQEFEQVEVDKVWVDGEYLTAGFLIVDHDARLIALMHRGTMSTENLLLDLDAQMIPLSLGSGEVETGCDGCKVHQGFWRAYNSSFSDLKPRLDTLIKKYPGYNLLLGGHSMGGAVSLIGAAHLKLEGYDFQLVTCGQPMVGNDKFANWIDGLLDQSGSLQERDILKLIRQYDPVPFYPTLGGYRPTSGEIFIKADRAPPRRGGAKAYFDCEGQKDQDCSWNYRWAAEATVPFLPYVHPDYGPGVYASCMEL